MLVVHIQQRQTNLRYLRTTIGAAASIVTSVVITELTSPDMPTARSWSWHVSYDSRLSPLNSTNDSSTDGIFLHGTTIPDSEPLTLTWWNHTDNKNHVIATHCYVIKFSTSTLVCFQVCWSILYNVCRVVSYFILGWHWLAFWRYNYGLPLIMQHQRMDGWKHRTNHTWLAGSR